VCPLFSPPGPCFSHTPSFVVKRPHSRAPATAEESIASTLLKIPFPQPQQKKWVPHSLQNMGGVPQSFPKWNCAEAQLPSRRSLPTDFVGAGLAPPGRRVLARLHQAQLPSPFDFPLSTFNSLQIFCSFHFPRRNRITPAMATIVSATTIEMYTPFCCKCA
jgi:hypothetical protein